MFRWIKSILTIVAGAILLLPIALTIMQASGHAPLPIIASSIDWDSRIDGLPVRLTSALGLRTSEPVVVGKWPPTSGQTYPDLLLSDQNGQPTKLSDFKGKVILVEYAAVPCMGCQAFSGGKRFGAFGDFTVQPGLESIEDYARRFANVQLGSHDLVFVQVLLYGTDLAAPSQAEVTAWADHFQLDRNANQIVLRGDPSMLSRETYDMIPGFHLIDREFVLRADSCGHHPQDNLYSDLLPLIPRL